MALSFGMLIRPAIGTVLSLVMVFAHDVPQTLAGLTADQVAIIANVNSRESLRVAEHYAMRRGVPLGHIVKLDLPSDDTMSRDDYERRLALPLRQALQAQGLHNSIRVLLTVYGVPLRVASPTFMAEERAWLRDVNVRLDSARSELVNLERQARNIALPPGSVSEPQNEQGEGAIAYERNVSFLFRVDQAIQEYVHRTRELQPATSDQGYRQVESIIRRHQGLAGLAQLHHEFPQPGFAGTPDAEAQIRVQQMEGLQLLGSIELPLRQKRAELYRQIESVYGLYGVFALAAMELNLLSDEQADASVDSELSVLWWDRRDYAAAWRRSNPFHHAFKRSERPPQRELPVLMVSRLDAPTAELAMRLVDRAIEVERHGLLGKAYLDARGLPVKAPSDTYGHYDQSLRDLDEFITLQGSYKSVLENSETRFHRPGEAPDVGLYIGWYRLRHYEDAFTFQPGAIGYHMASAEAVSLHNAGESGWCKNALERGITATIGSVGEPYLDAFPEPLEFVALLMTGQYSLVETYYLTSRWVSWRMVLVGDPLYNPWKTKPAAKRSALTMFSLAPIPPSDQTFLDPLRAKEGRQRAQERSRIRLDEILSQQVSR
jgi:uncharacterized protein (TIGR03790 family)